jgi:hypothetical protein
LPEQLRTPEGRREFFRRAKRELEHEVEDSELTDPGPEAAGEVPLELDAERSSRGPRGARGGCGRASASLSSIAGRTRTRSSVRARSGCFSRPSAWRQTWMWSAAPTRPTRPTGRRGDARWALSPSVLDPDGRGSLRNSLRPLGSVRSRRQRRARCRRSLCCGGGRRDAVAVVRGRVSRPLLARRAPTTASVSG